MTWPIAVQNHLAARLPILVRWLLWVRPKPFAGGPREGIGLWTGDDHEILTVEGEARTYYGAQGGMDVPPVRYQVGTKVASLEVGLSLTPEGQNLVRGYDTRIAPVQLHCAVYRPEDLALLGIRRMFKGVIDGTRIGTPEQGGQARMSLQLVSAARRGTMTVAGHKSDASQRLRDPDDSFRQDADLGTIASDTWAGDE